MVFFKFWPRSHGMSLQLIFLIFLGLVPLFDFYPGIRIFSKLFVDLEI